MFWLTLWRGIKAGFKNFFRNGWLSIATISIIVLTLFIVNTVSVITIISKKTLEDIQQKIDVSIYLRGDANENDIKVLMGIINRIPEVKDVKYISKEEALEVFKQKHNKDDIILQSIEELGNPLQPSLSIKMGDPNSYQEIINQVKQSEYNKIVSDIDYYSEKKPVIEKLNNIISTLKKVGAVIVGIFSIVAILVTFNSIRLTLYNYKREVEVMKLVGANHWFIRLPFIIEGMLYGFFAAWVSLLLFYPLVYFLNPYIQTVAPNVIVTDYLAENAIWVISMQLSIGVLLGAISSLLAIRRYLNLK